MKLFMLHDQFFDTKGEYLKIGGIETYIKDLCHLSEKIGIVPLIYQFSDENFVRKYKSFDVFGVRMKKHLSFRYKAKKLVKAVSKKVAEDDIVLFASDYLICKNKFKNSLAIQHGVAWDINSKSGGFLSNISHIFYSALRSMAKYYRFNYVKKIVCVDYNFLNWYRTQIKHIDNDFDVIPNYCKNVIKFEDKQVNVRPKIIFARRLIWYRGTELFASAIKQLHDEGLEFEVTIAGEGPDYYKLKKRFEDDNYVTFIKYDQEYSFDIHSKFDIAVIPTIGSEGTSLSLLEAMGAGCLSIATNVGGMTNIVLNKYNGLLISPSIFELKNALTFALTDKHSREQIQKNAINTIKTSFSFENWEKSWSKILNDFKGD